MSYEDAAALGLSTTGHTPTDQPSRALIEAICAVSVSKRWKTARLEWSLVRIWLGDSHCVCGQAIHERCEIANIHNGNHLEVGNICVHQFLGLETMPIFDSLRVVAKDIQRALSHEAIEHFYDCGWLNEWETDFYHDTRDKQKRGLTAKQMQKRVQVNEKILRLVQSNGLDE